MKSVFFVLVILATSLSYGMEEVKSSPCRMEDQRMLKRSPHLSISHEESSGQTISKPITIESPQITRVRAQSNGSPKFIDEENMHRLLKDLKLKKEDK